MNPHSEDQHSSQNPSENSEESVELSQTGHSDTPTKKKSNMVVYIVGGVFVVGAMFLGFRIFSAGHHAQPASRPIAQQHVVTPDATVASMASAPVVAPVPVASTFTPSASDVAANPGLPNLNGATSASGLASSSAINPAPLTPVASTPVITTPVAPSTIGSGATVDPSTLPVVTSPSMVTAPRSVTVDVASPVGKSSDSMSPLETTLRSLVSNTNDRVDTLTARVDKLESRLDSGSVSVKREDNASKSGETPKETAEDGKKNASEAKASIKHRHAVAMHRERVRMGRHRSQDANSVELIDAPAVRGTSDSGELFSKPVSTNVVEKVVPTPTYKVKAVVPGRVWIQRKDGTVNTYGLGDPLPDGRKVGRIDTDKGVYDTHGELLPQG